MTTNDGPDEYEIALMSYLAAAFFFIGSTILAILMLLNELPRAIPVPRPMEGVSSLTRSITIAVAFYSGLCMLFTAKDAKQGYLALKKEWAARKKPNAPTQGSDEEKTSSRGRDDEF